MGRGSRGYSDSLIWPRSRFRGCSGRTRTRRGAPSMSSFNPGQPMGCGNSPATDVPSAPRIERTLNTQVLDLDEPAAWSAIVRRSMQHDVYHLPEYHALATERGEGRGVLFVVT